MGSQAVKDLLVGVLIGAVSNLPGASGATIAVVFGIYERLVSDIADITGKLLHDMRFIIVIFSGFIIGMILCAKGLKMFIAEYEVPTMFFFATLIMAQIPEITRMGDDSRPLTRNNVLAFVGGIAVMSAFVVIGIVFGNADNQNPGFAVMFLAGIVYAMSKLAPGISGSTVLLALGLFTVFNTALADVNLDLLLPVFLGVVFGALVFAKVIQYFMEHSRKSTYAAILGLTVGSVIAVLIDAFSGFSGTDMIPQSVIGASIGAVAGMFLGRLARIYSESAENA